MGEEITFSVSDKEIATVNPATVVTEADGSATTTLTVLEGPAGTLTATYMACDRSLSATELSDSIEFMPQIGIGYRFSFKCGNEEE